MVISSVLNSSTPLSSQSSDLVMEAIEATQFDDLNRTMDKNFTAGIPIPDSDKNVQRSQQRRKKRAQKRVRYDSVQSSFDDFYELTGEILGEGAYAKVQGCIHKETGKEYAVKTVIKHAGLSRARVFKEIEIFYHCQGHKNIIQLIEFFEEDRFFFMIFEKINGGPLLAHIQKRVHFTENEASLIIRDLASALQFIHQKGIAHRDLKPENILCTSETSPCPVKICDFDLSSKADSEHEISTPTLLSPVGSPLYLSPQIASNFMGQSQRYDKRCDLWSLGVIMYILLSGNPPFFMECGNDCGWERGDFCQLCQDLLFNSIQEGIYDFPESEWSAISDDAKDLIKHLLVKDASQRYTADMVLKHRWVAHGGPTTPLETPSVMRKNNSYKDLAAFANGANQIKRLIAVASMDQDVESMNEQEETLALNESGQSLQQQLKPQKCIGSYKNSLSSSLTQEGDSSPISFELNFTSDEDGDAFYSDIDQENRSSTNFSKTSYASALESRKSKTSTMPNKTVKWVDLQEEDEDEYLQSSTPPKPVVVKSASKCSIDSDELIIEALKSKLVDTVKRNSETKSTTTSSIDCSSDQSSDLNNNHCTVESADTLKTDEVETSEDQSIDKQSLANGPKSKLEKMLECIENRKKLSFSASCYVISKKNNQTASLNFCPGVKSMLII